MWKHASRKQMHIGRCLRPTHLPCCADVPAVDVLIPTCPTVQIVAISREGHLHPHIHGAALGPHSPQHEDRKAPVWAQHSTLLPSTRR